MVWRCRLDDVAEEIDGVVVEIDGGDQCDVWWWRSNHAGGGDSQQRFLFVKLKRK